MKQRTIVQLVTSLAMVAATSVVNAEDFVINVPLRYVNLDAHIVSSVVNCNVYSDAARTDLVAGAGSGQANIDPDGNYTGTLRIAFNARPGKNAADGRYYHCRSGFSYTTSTMTDPSVLVRQRGTPYVNLVSGEIPR